MYMSCWDGPNNSFSSTTRYADFWMPNWHLPRLKWAQLAIKNKTSKSVDYYPLSLQRPSELFMRAMLCSLLFGFKVVYHLTGYLEDRLSEPDVICAIVFVVAALVLVVNWHFSACLGFCDILYIFILKNSKQTFFICSKKVL